MLATARIAKLYVTRPLAAGRFDRVWRLVSGTLRSMMVTKMKTALGLFVALSVFRRRRGFNRLPRINDPVCRRVAAAGAAVADQARPPASRDVQLSSYRDGMLVLIGTEIKNEAKKRFRRRTGWSSDDSR